MDIIDVLLAKLEKVSRGLTDVQQRQRAEAATSGNEEVTSFSHFLCFVFIINLIVMPALRPGNRVTITSQTLFQKSNTLIWLDLNICFVLKSC